MRILIQSGESECLWIGEMRPEPRGGEEAERERDDHAETGNTQQTLLVRPEGLPEFEIETYLEHEEYQPQLGEGREYGGGVRNEQGSHLGREKCPDEAGAKHQAREDLA